MQSKLLLWATGILTVAVTAGRVLLLPVAAGDGVGLTTVNYPLLLVMAAAVVVLLWLGRGGKDETFGAFSGGDAATVAATGGLFGLLLLGTAAWDAFQWVVNGSAPAPSETIRNAADRLALVASLLAGAVAGVFLLALFIGRRKTSATSSLPPVAAAIVGVVGMLAGVTVVLLAIAEWRQTTVLLLNDAGRRSALLGLVLKVGIGLVLTVAFFNWLRRGDHHTGWLWLVVVVWLFARVVRYDVTYATAVDIAPAVYEFLTYGVSLVFLLAAAQYFAGVLKPSRWLRGLAASTAALTLGAVLSRLVLTMLGQSLAVAYCPLPGVVDVGLGLFALAVVSVPSAAAEPAAETIDPA